MNLYLAKYLKDKNYKFIMEILKNISPIDGRYNKNTLLLKEYFSEYAFMKYKKITFKINPYKSYQYSI